jgi:hypothetical protein
VQQNRIFPLLACGARIFSIHAGGGQKVQGHADAVIFGRLCPRLALFAPFAFSPGALIFSGSLRLFSR